MHSRTWSQDRRAAHRLPLALKVRLNAAGTEAPGTSIDVSTTGMFVETIAAVSPGSEVRLAFAAADPERSLVEVDGRAARAVSREEARHFGILPGIGIEFQNFRAGRTALLQDLFRRLRAEGGILSKLAPDRRRGRTRVTVPVLWSPKPPPNRRGAVVNVSSSGAFVATSEPVPIGTRVYLLFELGRGGGNDALKAVARVVRVNPPGAEYSPEEPVGMGLVFELGSGDDNLVYYLEQQLSRLRRDSLLDVTRKPTEATASAELEAAALSLIPIELPPEEEQFIPELELETQEADILRPKETSTTRKDQAVLQMLQRAREQMASSPAKSKGPPPKTAESEARDAAEGVDTSFDWKGALWSIGRLVGIPLAFYLLVRIFFSVF